MVAYTTTYSFAKPTVGDDEDVWGGLLNGNFDSIENLLKGTTALSALKVTGVLSVGNSSPKTWHSNSTGVIQFGGVGALENYNTTDDPVIWSANQYRASDGNFKYIETNEASRISQYAGEFYFQTAPSGTADTNATFTTRLKINNGGNIGIGTSSPERPLHISASPPIILLEDTGGGTDDKRAQIHVDTGVFQIKARNDDNSGRTDILTADLGTGHVGLGTTSPASLLHLDQGSGGNGLRFERDSYDTMDIELSESGLRIRNETDGRTDVLIDGSGLVGIGTTSPVVPLNIEAAGSTSAGENTHLRINDTTNMAAGVGGVIQLSGEAASGSSTQYTFATIKGIKENGTSGNYDGALTFSTRTNGASPAAERMRITSDGSVGIGTTSPSSTLDVNGAITTTGQLTVDNDSGVKVVYGTETTNVFYTGYGIDSARGTTYIRPQVDNTQTLYIGNWNDALDWNTIAMKVGSNDNVTINGNKVFHAGNDGSGSGLDADTVDGIQASSFLRSDANDSASGDITFTGFVTFDNDTNPAVKIISDNFADGLEIHRNHASYAAAIKFSNTSGQQGILYSNSSGEIVWRPLATTNAYAIWHSGNDGSGSGLDADTVDGIEASSFLRSDASDTTSGDTITFSSTSASPKLDMTGNGGSSSYNYLMRGYNDGGLKAVHYINGSARTTDGGVNTYTIRNDGGPLRLGRTSQSTLIEGSGDLTYNGNEVWHAGNDGAGSGLDADNLDGYTWFTYGKNIRAYELYSDSWLRNYYSGKGLYNQATGQHWYSDHDDYWNVAGGSSANGIRFRDEYGGTIRGYVYADSSNNVGFLDAGGSWAIRHTNDLKTEFRITNSVVAQITSSGMDVTGSLTVNGAAVGGGGSTHTATASGAIANGDPCIVNSDGTVSAVAATATAPSIGTETQLENFYNSFYRRIATGGGWVVAIYKRQSNYLQARIGAVSGGAITWSSSVFTIYSANFVYAAISYDTNASRFIISYRDNLNGLRYYRAKSMAVSGTISSLSVSFGSEVTLQTGAYNSYMDHVYHPTENKTIAFNRSNSPSSIAYILTCNASNGAVTKDTNTTVNSSYGGGNEVGVCYDSGEDALVFVWEVSSGSELVARAATLSGSTLTFGSEVSVSGSGVASWFADNYNVPIASDGNGNILVTWTNNSNVYAYATLLTLSGTTLTKQNDTLINGSVTTKNTALAYDETQNNFAVMYQDNSSTGKVNTLTVSGTTVSVYGTETQIDSGSTGQTDIAYFSDLGGSVMLYQKGGTNYSYSNHYISTSSSTNMTTSNYIGIADAAYANAATATIQVVGSVDDAQSGLTPGQTYYVQKDGSLGTTADSPSVIAGTAVSATEIIVKG